MKEEILTYGIGILGVVALMIGWIGIQAVWRRVFSDHITDSDVLADRRSCGNCGCTTACEIKKQK